MNRDGHVWIDMSKSCCEEALEQFCGRLPHMQQKYRNPNPFNRLRSGLFGLIIEKHVYNFLREEFPNNIHPPSNHNDYRAVCGHDFRLELNGKSYLFDVFGQLFSDFREGKSCYDTSIRSKPECEFYAFARIVDDGWSPNPRVLFEGWTSRNNLEQYKERYRFPKLHLDNHDYPWSKFFWSAKGLQLTINKRLSEYVN